MKKLATLMLLFGMFSTNAMADSVSCYVDTMKYDEYRQGLCFGGETNWQFTPKIAFKVNTNRAVESVVWKFSGVYDRSSASQCEGTSCIIDVPKVEANVTACVDKIYYSDFTWADVNWCATAEYMYTNGGGFN